MKALAGRIRRGIGNKGLSLVEVICAVAIFAVIAATVGSVLVFSAKSYQRGSTESEIQQEAQFAANRISGIIQNATEVSYSVVPMPGGYNVYTLEMQKGNEVHKVSLADNETDLKYSETVKDDTGAETTSSAQVLAGNITAFQADVSEFDQAHTVILDLTVSKNDKEYLVRYTMNARNEEINVSTSALPPSASIFVDDSSLILVPGESYTLGVKVRGTDKDFTATAVGGITVAKAADSITITVNKETRDSSAYVKLLVEDGGTELCNKIVNINIRSVNSLELKKNRAGDGSEYTLYADVACNNSAKVVGGSSEDNYKNPYAVEWSGKILVCGTTPGEFDTEVASFKVEDDGSGNKLVCSDEEAVKKYICVDDTYPGFAASDEEETLKRPYFNVKLTDSFDANTKLVVRAVSKHAAGVNKASSEYGVFTDAGKEVYWDEEEITVAKLKSTKILMVPGQTYTLSGVRVANPECTVKIGATETTQDNAGVIATFEEGNKFKIQLTENAKGDSHGIITLDIHSQGSTATQLTVEIYVRRVNPQPQSGDIRQGNLKVDYQLMKDTEGKHSPNGEWGVSAEYQFKSRINGTNLFFDDTTGFINTETEDQYKTYNPFAVKFEWVLKIGGHEVDETRGGAVVTHYERGAENGSVYVTADSTTGSQDNSYFMIIDYALNKEAPAVNIKMKQAFQYNWELVVTAQALHPNIDGTNARNKYNFIYTELTETEPKTRTYIKGSYTLKKDKTIIELSSPEFKRGQEYFFGNSKTDININDTNYKDKIFFYYRFYDFTTMKWSPYFQTEEKGNPQKFCADETFIFRPDREYYVEFVQICADLDKKELYYPTDESLIKTDDGYDSGFEGFTIKKDTRLMDAMKGDQFPVTYHIPRAVLVVNGGGTGSSEANPMKLKSWHDNTYDLGPLVSYELNMYDSGNTVSKDLFKPGKVQKRLADGSWVDVPNSEWEAIWKYDQTDNGIFKLRCKVDNAVGMYRIGVELGSKTGGGPFKEISGKLNDKHYNDLQINMPFYDTTSDKGFIYIEFTS